MRSAILRGREHPTVGTIATVTEATAAIAISTGGARKTYAHTDPNEDAAAFATGPGAVLLAVADAHRGFEASEVVLEHLLANPAPHWTEPGGVSPESWQRHAIAALCDANREILRERIDSERGASRTTLALGLWLPAQAQLLTVSVGDSHLFLVGLDGGARELLPADEANGFFLGHCEETPDSLSRKSRVGTTLGRDARALVLVTDGLSERHVGVEDPAAAVAEAVARAAAAPAALRAREAARGVLEAALEAHRRNPSGDNTAAAVLWLEEEPSGR